MIHENYQILKSFTDECRKPKIEQIRSNKDIIMEENCSQNLKFSNLIKEKKLNLQNNKLPIYEIKW